MWLFPFPITRFIPLLLDCHHHDVRLCVQECVCVSERACAGGCLLINHFSAGISCYWCQSSKVNVSGKGLTLKTRLSTSWSIQSLSPWSLSLLFFSHIHFFLNSLFYFSIDTLSSLRFKCHKEEKKNKLDLFNIQLFFSRQQCS